MDTSGDSHFLIGLSAGVLSMLVYVGLTGPFWIEIVIGMAIAYGALALSRRI